MVDFRVEPIHHVLHSVVVKADWFLANAEIHHDSFADSRDDRCFVIPPVANLVNHSQIIHKVLLVLPIIPALGWNPVEASEAINPRK